MPNIVIGVGALGITIYLILRIIHAGLHEFKSIFFLNSSNIAVAVILADVYVVFDVLCIKAISTADVYTSCVVMVIATTLSITSAMLYQRKNLKEYIFKFEISIKSDEICEEIKKEFKEHNIPWKQYFYYYENDKEDEKGETKYNELQVYAFTKAHSKRIKNILQQYDYKDVKYAVINTSNYKE